MGGRAGGGRSPYDTLVLVLQNGSGARRWPCKRQGKVAAAAAAGPSLRADLLRAFAQAVPTDAAARRRAREGRGFGDADGGGGVYRGKKRGGPPLEGAAEMKKQQHQEQKQQPAVKKTKGPLSARGLGGKPGCAR